MPKQSGGLSGSYHVRVEKYRQTRYWAVWLDEVLLAVTVYKKGAVAIQQFLAADTEVTGRLPGVVTKPIDITVSTTFNR